MSEKQLYICNSVKDCDSTTCGHGKAHEYSENSSVSWGCEKNYCGTLKGSAKCICLIEDWDN